MRKLFRLLCLCCVVLPMTAVAEGNVVQADSSFFNANYVRTIMYDVDSITIKSELRKLELKADSNLNPTDCIELIINDSTKLFKTGFNSSRVAVFNVDSVDVSAWDTLETVDVRYIPQKGSDTLLYCVSKTNELNKYYTPQPELSFVEKLFCPKWKWWTIGGLCILVLLIAGGVVLFLYLKKKKEKVPSIDNDTQNDLPIDDDNSDNDDSGNDNSRDDDIDVGEDNKEIKRLKGIIEKLNNEKTQLIAAQETAINKLKEDHKKEIEKLEKDAQKILDDAQQRWNQEKEKQEDSKKKELLKKDEKISRLENEIDELEQKVKSIRDEVSKEKEKEIDELKDKLKSTKNELTSTSEELRNTKSTLEKTEGQLSNAKDQIGRLTEAQQQYAEKITFAPYAEAYSNQIIKLFEIEHRINEGVIALSKKGLADPYHLFKASHRFRVGIADIDMEKFQVEVEMAAKKQMTFTGNGIAHLATLSGDELSKQVRMYFVLNYLTKYINALQIYNESLIGLDKLMDDVSSSDVAQFVQIRQQLEKLYDEMKIKVVCPRLFESIGNNMDLRVEQVDAGFDSGDILEIMNCLVYAVDGQKPTDKIFVKAQQ